MDYKGFQVLVDVIFKMAADMNKFSPFLPEDEEEDVNSICVPHYDAKARCMVMKCIRAPPKSPFGLYEWVNLKNGNVEAVIDENEREDLMMEEQIGRQGCILRIKSSSTICVPDYDVKTDCMVLKSVPGPPTSPSGLYEWFCHLTAGAEVIDEEERKKLMTGEKIGKFNCTLVVQPHWYKANFMLKPLASTQKILDEIHDNYYWQDYAIFISLSEVYLIFKLDTNHIKEFFNMLRDTDENVALLQIAASQEVPIIRALMKDTKWSLRGYKSKKFRDILNTLGLALDLSDEEKKHDYMHWRGLPDASDLPDAMAPL